jgi:hypothetical protein
MQSQYYYFVAGLPALNVEDTKCPITQEVFWTDAKNHLSKADFRLLLLMAQPEDAQDILTLIYKREDESKPLNECSKMFWQTYVDIIKQKAADPGVLIPEEYRCYPEFLHKICLEIFSAEEMPPFLESQHKLLEAVFAYCEELGNPFISAWYALNRDLQNILTAINGRKHKIDFARYLIGKGEMVEKLAKSHTADFGLAKESELFESVIRIWEQNNILYRERGYDILRWKWIENQVFFDYFNINRILGYYAQLRILNRWLGMEASHGKEVFHDTLDNLANSFTFPEQFNTKSISKK